MSLTDPIADMLTRIRNGQMSKLVHVNCPSSKMKLRVLDVLAREGYIRGYKVEKISECKSEIKIELKYISGSPVIKKITKISKPGRRVYTKLEDMKKISNGLGIAIVSTSKGVLSDHEARSINVGGEVICSVF